MDGKQPLLLWQLGHLSMILFSPVFKGDEIKNNTLDNEPSQTLKEALNEASGHIHYWLLIAGFFVCGFQLAFIVVHMPSYLADKGFDSSVAAAISLSIIGLCNIFGSLISGHLSGIYSKKWILTYIYAARSIIIVLFLITPISTFTIYAFSFATGLSLACNSPTYIRISCSDVWLKIYGHTLRYRFSKPSNWLIYRCLDWRLSL